MELPATTSPLRPSRRHLARRAGVALGLLGLAWVGAHALVDGGPVHRRIRERAGAILSSRLPGATIGDEVSVDWFFRATVGPLTIPATADGAPPVVAIDRIKVRIAWWPLLSGRVEPASIRLYGVRISPGAGGAELRRLVSRLRQPRAPRQPHPSEPTGVDPVVHVRDLVVAVPVGRELVELGPFDLKLERTRDAVQELIDAELGLPGGGHLAATLTRDRRGGPPDMVAPSTMPAGKTTPDRPAPPPPAPPSAWSLAAHLSATPADLPAALVDRAVTASGGALSIDAKASGRGDAARLELRGALTGLTLAGAPLGTEPVGPIELRGEAAVEVALAARRLRLERAVLRPAGPLAIEATGRLELGGQAPFELSVTVPPVDYRALVEALPSALAPGPDAPRPAGAVGGSLLLSGLLHVPEAWIVRAEVDLAGLRDAAKKEAPSPLRAPFIARPGGEEGPAILLGPANPAFVPIVELPEHVVRAVTTSEDAGFFAHRGFDFDELKNALLAGVKAGKLQRGGSTISQQLAKNLFLSRDRTLARKAREALVTVALEGTVPKARLLEIYLNLIEWGPGIYGIGPAARHYLDKDARALTPREACFLATLIPSPRRSHAALEAGVPVQRWDERIDDLLGKLLVTGVLDEETVTRERAATLTLASWVPRAASSGPAAGEAPPESDEPGPTGAADDPAAGGGPRRGVDPSPRTGPSGPGAP